MAWTEPQDFADRQGVALVTGGTGGIGSEICRTLAARGSNVALTYRRDADTAQVLLDHAKGHGREAHGWALDLGDTAACRRVVDEVVGRFGGVHTFVHAAGPLVPQVHLSRVEPAEFRRHVDEEAAGLFSVVSPLIPHLRASRGSIVAVTTAALRRYPVRDGLSAVPKASVAALVRALAVEEGRYGVRANAVGPGMLTDGMARRLMESGDLDDEALAVTRSNIPLRRFGNAADVAEAVCFLASDRAGFVTGQMLDVDGGYGV